jgi:predicted nucleotidyltransferase
MGQAIDSASFEAEIGQLAVSLYRIDGVLNVFLFGSHARGEAVKGSDVDIMVLFKDEKSLWRGRKEVFKAAAVTSLLTQVLARTIEEFWERTEPTFREEILRDGRLLHPDSCEERSAASRKRVSAAEEGRRTRRRRHIAHYESGDSVGPRNSYGA